MTKREPITWIVNDHVDVGDEIFYSGRTSDRLQHGWTGRTTPVVAVGDLMVTSMGPGRTATFEVTDVDVVGGGNQWFARASVDPVSIERE